MSNKKGRESHSSRRRAQKWNRLRVNATTLSWELTGRGRGAPPPYPTLPWQLRCRKRGRLRMRRCQIMLVKQSNSHWETGRQPSEEGGDSQPCLESLQGHFLATRTLWVAKGRSPLNAEDTCDYRGAISCAKPSPHNAACKRQFSAWLRTDSLPCDAFRGNFQVLGCKHMAKY